MRSTTRLCRAQQLSLSVRDMSCRTTNTRSALLGPSSSAVQAGNFYRRTNTSVQQRRGITISQLDNGREGRERVIILGSGWAGFTVARKLDSDKYQAVVVSPRDHFTFTPLLASTAVGTLEFRTAMEPVKSRRTKVNFFQGWADTVDFKNKIITIEEAADDPAQGLARTTGRHGNAFGAKRNGESIEAVKKGKLFDLVYDKLVISVGCYSQTFGTPGVKEHAFFLKDVGDARKIRNRLLACFELAALPTTSDEAKTHLLNFAVVGGGPTGIEFAAELHDIIHEDLARIYPELMSFHRITVYDVAAKVLPMFDSKIADYALVTLRREGISIKTQHHVESLYPGTPGTRSKGVTEDHAVFTLTTKEEGEISVGMVVWSTGLMMNPLIANALRQVPELPADGVRVSGPEFDQKSPSSVRWEVKKHPKTASVVTDDRLRVKLISEEEDQDRSEAVLKHVFALGDCSVIEGTSYPATAQVASQKALWLAKRLNKGDIERAPFTWRNLGVMAYIGNWNALFQGGTGHNVSGRAAWVLWRGAYLTRSVSLRNKILIPTYWFLNWLFGRDIGRF
ncbi:pyridine nucleotide-disulfide oxidoreductase-domain-containing protein [Massariosphaeria phaeospora]|uniref:Pyridine nucleotide-disulfide oxidoreductase-domain-containing protein n=1 Tax=Massariosphaeria phaeospora TaxID=100035 RepID=A0A7C8MCA6_9PLEO|nr:pyridine nucleotide-disulfide oxidoreductase-domain-containing protein [Massariosphaeria phaeospora]